MRKEKTGKLREKLLLGVFTLVLVATFGLSGVFVSYASQAKVTARNGANIRKEASASSDKVGGVKQGETLNIISTVKGADGKDWYQVSYNNLSGYVRSDLVTVTEGSVPPAEGNNGGEINDPPADVRPLNPVGATVTKDSGRVRANPSVSSTIVSEVPNGLVLTVTGDVTDADGSVWYQVNYNSGDTTVNGFIRSDYVTLEADTTPVTDTPPDTQEPPQDPVVPDKPYDTILHEGEWHLLDTATNNAYKIEDLFASVNTANTNAALYEEVAKSEKNQKIIIIILVFLLVAAVAGIAFLVFKIKDMMDAAYFSEVENDALRKRKATSQGGSQRAVHAMGAEGQQGRSAGARQSGASQGQRAQGASQRSVGTSQGQRTSGGMSQGQRMQGAGQNQRSMGSSQGQRIQGSGQEQRMQGSGQGQRMQSSGQGQRMQSSGQGQRMQDFDQDQRTQRSNQRLSEDLQYERLAQDQRQGSQGQRGSSTGQRSMGAPQGARPVPSAQEGAQRAQRRNEDQGWQSKNFMAEEEEEFDLEFLNYDEEQ